MSKLLFLTFTTLSIASAAKWRYLLSQQQKNGRLLAMQQQPSSSQTQPLSFFDYSAKPGNERPQQQLTRHGWIYDPYASSQYPTHKIACYYHPELGEKRVYANDGYIYNYVHDDTGVHYKLITNWNPSPEPFARYQPSNSRLQWSQEAMKPCDSAPNAKSSTPQQAQTQQPLWRHDPYAVAEHQTADPTTPPTHTERQNAGDHQQQQPPAQKQSISADEQRKRIQNRRIVNQKFGQLKHQIATIFDADHIYVKILNQFTDQNPSPAYDDVKQFTQNKLSEHVRVSRLSQSTVLGAIQHEALEQIEQIKQRSQIMTSEDVQQHYGQILKYFAASDSDLRIPRTPSLNQTNMKLFEEFIFNQLTN